MSVLHGLLVPLSQPCLSCLDCQYMSVSQRVEPSLSCVDAGTSQSTRQTGLSRNIGLCKSVSNNMTTAVPPSDCCTCGMSETQLCTLVGSDLTEAFQLSAGDFFFFHREHASEPCSARFAKHLHFLPSSC